MKLQLQIQRVRVCLTTPSSPSFFFIRRNRKRTLIIREDFSRTDLRPVHVTSARPNLVATRKGGRKSSPFPHPDIPGYVYLRRRGRASDGGRSKVARWGIETYLLAQLAPVQRHPPLSSRRNFDPESAGQLPREIRISQICSRRCKLNSGCFGCYYRACEVLLSTCVKNVSGRSFVGWISSWVVFAKIFPR